MTPIDLTNSTNASGFTPDSRHVSSIHASPNINDRRGTTSPSLLILHYTGLLTLEHTLQVLSDPACQVSCHYVVDEAGHITQMVPESMRAWHAGVSSWHRETDINSHSIGIEIHNPGHAHGYPDFPNAQMTSVIALARDIVERHAIAPECVLAHSDVAPQRKDDPGEKFDWRRLFLEGVGHWVEPIPAHIETSHPLALADLQDLLRRYGYQCPHHNKLDEETQKVLTAFQRHFRPEKVDGKPDYSTYATLQKLLDALPDDESKTALKPL